MTPIRMKAEQTRHIKLRISTLPASKFIRRLVEVSLLLLLASSCVFAQAAAEYGGATSSMAGSIGRINIMNRVKFPNTNQQKPSVIMSQPNKGTKESSKYIFESMKVGSVAANRKALEERAGKNASKLMLRSTPTDATVKINGKPVGKTPILLVLPPGQYDVAMYGKRMDHAEQKVDLLPKETREFAFPLKQQYPTEVMIHLH